MKTSITFIFIFWLLIFFLSSCQQDNSSGNSSNPVIPKSSKDLVVSPNFKFSTVKDVPITITALDNQNKALSNVKFSILTDYRNSGGKDILSASTDENGVISLTYTFPDYLDSVVVATDFLGLPNETKVSTKLGQIVLTLGGPYPVTKSAEVGRGFKSVSASNLKTPLGAWDSNGVPKYLEPTNDVIDASFLNDINTMLPERIDIRKKAS